MATEQKSALNIVMGAMTFGKEGAEGARVHTIDGVSAILDVFQKHGHTEASLLIDTARTYTGGSSEEFLGEVGWQQRGLKMETKLYPNVSGSRYSGTLKISHSPEDLRKFLDISLETLKTDSVDIWYLHAPDRTTPYEVTFKAVNELYKEGKFKRLGISNYMSWEVAEIVGICKANGYI
ncbi:NADP-dependent oxidoreductase domain-containing protein, partial [Cristinia sonorae]